MGDSCELLRRSYRKGDLGNASEESKREQDGEKLKTPRPGHTQQHVRGAKFQS